METSLDARAADFAALAHPARLAIFRLLARRAPGRVPAGEIAQATGLRANTASVHLATLARSGLIEGRRAGKQVLYALDAARTGALIDYLALDCCRGRPALCAPLTRAVLTHPGTAGAGMRTVLFLCTGNSARSIMAEAILNGVGAGRFRAHSAGIRPRAALNPHAVETLVCHGFETAGLRPKHPDVFRGADAPRFDLIITVCDAAANAESPPWPGHPVTGHWSVPDPARATGPGAARAFDRAFALIRRRIAALCALPIDAPDRAALQGAVDRIGQGIDETAET